MAAISKRQPEVVVEYDSKDGRIRKHFKDPYAARRFYTAKHKAGLNPRVLKPEAPAKLVAAYVRVSTQEQNEASQVAEIERWLTGNGIDPACVQWFVDKKSGDSLERPAFADLQKAIFNGEVRTVVIFKLDRLSRKLREGIDVLCDWIDRGLRVVSVTQQIDFNGTVGKIIASVLIGISEFEQETRRERQRANIAAAKKRGAYKNCGRPKGTTKARPKRAIELRDKGYTAEEIARAMGVSRNTVFRYFRTA